MSYVDDNSTSELWEKIKEKLTYNIATSSSSGLMSSSDVGELNELEAALEAKQGGSTDTTPPEIDVYYVMPSGSYDGGTSAKTFDGEITQINQSGNQQIIADAYSSADWGYMDIMIGYLYSGTYFDNPVWEQCYSSYQALGSSFPNTTYYLWWDDWGYDEYYVIYVRSSSGSNYTCSVRVQNYSSEYMIGSCVVSNS